MEKLYSSTEVCEATGCSYRQLDYWDSTGVVQPTQPARGSGTQRGYSLEDAIGVALVAAVADVTGGIPRGVTEAVASSADLVLVRTRLERRIDEPRHGPHRTTETIPVVDVKELLAELRNGPATVVDLGALRDEVVKRLPARRRVAA